MKKSLQKALLTICVFAFLSCSSNDESSNNNHSGNNQSGNNNQSEKTDIKTYTGSGTTTLKYTGSTITEIEIYALGGGGGGGYKRVCSNMCEMIGNRGGGGAATYVKLGNLGLSTGEEVVLDITIGAGGNGCNYNVSGSACSGKNGEQTTVRIIEKNTAVTANGGSAGTNNSSGNAAGGSTSSLPTQSTFYKDGVSIAGGSGNDGGNAAKITRGSLSSFGGGNGGDNGSGGSGATNGGKGLAKVVVKYK